jgi:predicted site-specific integrase-resolvase
MKGWTKIKNAAAYAGVSERTVRNWMKRGLRYSRLESGAVFFSFSWIDEYLEKFEVNENIAETIVNEALREMQMGE